MSDISETALTLFTQFTANQNRIEPFKEAIGNLVTGMRQEQGCLICNAFAQKDDATSFVLFEQWESQADLDKHHEGEPFKTFHAQWDTLITKDPESHKYDPL